MIELFKFQNEYTKGGKALEKELEKSITTNTYITYCKFINKAKENYKIILGNDLERIQNETNRLGLEIECCKTPAKERAFSVLILFAGLIFQDILIGGITRQSQEFHIAEPIVSSVYLIIMACFILRHLSKYDIRLKCYMFTLQALKELEEEVKRQEHNKNKHENSTKKESADLSILNNKDIQTVDSLI